MIKIDTALLQEIGLDSLPQAEKDGLLKHIYETLEMRVGMRLADQMTDQQLDEFEQYFEAKDDAGAFKWLESNFPNYKDIVQQEFDKLKAEVAQSAPQILASSHAESVQPSVSQFEPVQPAVPQVQPAEEQVVHLQQAPPVQQLVDQAPPVGPAGPYVPQAPQFQTQQPQQPMPPSQAVYPDQQPPAGF
jgi:hypothetical protein